MLREGCESAIRNRPAALFCELPELAGIRDAVWQEALSVSQVLSCPAGTKLMDCRDHVDKFVMVLQGVVKVYDTGENGREICLYRVSRGQVCTLTLTRLLLQSRRGAQSVAEQDVRLLLMPTEYFHRLLSESDAFRRYLINSMAHCLSDVMQLITEVSFQNLELRLTQLILERSRLSAPDKLRCTHQTIANELGTSREVVSRLLKDLERAGLVKLHRGSIEVIATGKLEAFYRKGDYES